MKSSDPYELERFVKAQQLIYDQVLFELTNGEKRSHWMWFIFPQIEGLGHSSTSIYYSIKSLEEAQAYLSHPILGSRLVECAGILLQLEGKTASEIFGFPDDLKLRSSMTLFACAAGEDSLFARMLDKYFSSQKDERTLKFIEYLKNDRDKDFLG